MSNNVIRKYFKFLIIILISFIFGLESFSQTATAWPNYRGSNILNGITHSKFETPMKLSWSVKIGDEIKSSPIICENMIYVGSMDGTFYALDLSGKIVWKYKAESSIEASPIFIKKTVIIGCSSGKVYAFDYKNGTLKWTYNTDAQVLGAANWSTDGNNIQILIPCYDFCLHSLSLESGKLNWKCKTDNYLNGSPATDNKIIVAGGCDSYLHIINAKSGKETGKVNVGTYIAESPALSDNLAFVGDYDGNFICIDISKKTIKWKFTNPKISPFLSSPAVDNDRVIIGSNDKKVYCFNKQTGKILWTYQTYGKIDSSPVLFKDKVVICSGDGIIHFISLIKGEKLYTYEVGTSIKSSPAIIDNVLVVAGKDGKIYTFKGK
jgi:outer membrane protein assembly factor BamB